MAVSMKLDQNNYGLVMIDRVFDAVSSRKGYEEEHCDGRPEDRQPTEDSPALAEMSLIIRLEECVDPVAFRQNLEAVARELQTRWNHEPAWTGMDGLNLARSEAYGKCVECIVSFKDPYE